MKKLLFIIGLFLATCGEASAQNATCSDRPSTDSSNACANTRFVQNHTVNPSSIALPNGEILIGSMSGVAAAHAMSGDCTISNTGAITCTKTNNVPFGPFATATDATNLISSFNGGLNASASTFWRGDGIWAVPPGTPQILPSNYNASGSSASTTGSITTGMATLTLASASDFSNGQYIRVNRAGATFGASPPTSLSAVAQGTTGATARTYNISCLTTTGGVGQAVSTVVPNSNATLSPTNYVVISWTGGAGCGAYAVYGRDGSQFLLGITTLTSFADSGAMTSGQATTDWIPATPAVANLNNWLIAAILSGGGTTSLTLGTNASNTATTQVAIHDDTTPLQNAINAAISAGQPLYLPKGVYRITSTLTSNNRLVWTGAGYSGDNGYGFRLIGGFSPPVSDIQCTGTGAIICVDVLVNAFAATTNRPQHLSWFEITYPYKPAYGTVAVRIADGGNAGDINSNTIIEYMQLTGYDTGILMYNSGLYTINGVYLLYGWSQGIINDTPNYPSFSQSIISNNFIWGNGSDDHIWNTFQASILLQAGGDFRIYGNKLQASSPAGSGIWMIGCSACTQNMEPMNIYGNTIEGQGYGIRLTSSNANFSMTQFSIVGNQIWAGTRAVLFEDNPASSYYAIGGTITGNSLAVNGGVNAIMLQLDDTQATTITGNFFGYVTCTTCSAQVWGTNTNNVISAANTYQQPGITTAINNAGTANNPGTSLQP